MKKLLIGALALGSLILSGCNNGDKGLLDGGGSGGLVDKADSLVVTPKNATIPVGLTQQMKAEAVLENAQVIDVTTHSSVVWSIDNSGIATIDAKGLVTGKAKGTVTITATGTNADGSVVQDTASLNVSDAVPTALQVTPKTATIAKGLTQAYVALATMSDGQVLDVTQNANVTWASSAANIASINNSDTTKGVATGLVQGTTTITASGTLNNVSLSDTATLNVSAAQLVRVTVTPATSAVPVGFSRQFNATAELSDGTTQDVTANANWTSDNTALATVSNDADTKGQATGVLQTGSTPVTITATVNIDGTDYPGTASLSVTDAVLTSLVVTPTSASVPVGLRYDFTATAVFSDDSTLDVTHSKNVSWSSSAPNTATVGNSDNGGEATGISQGDVIITATTTLKDVQVMSGTANLTVTDATVQKLVLTPRVETTPVGLSKPFTATAILSDGSTKNVTNDPAIGWSATNAVAGTTVATIGPDGVAKGMAIGQAVITASGTVNGQELKAEARLDVTNAVMAGLQVTPAVETTPVGLIKSFTATAIMSDNSTVDVTNDASVSWTSNDVNIATVTSSMVSGNGVATGLAVGQTQINAKVTVNGHEFTGSARLDVTAATVSKLVITPRVETTPVGLVKAFTATAILSDGSTQNVTDEPLLSWTSSNTTIATVTSGAASGNGVAKGEAVGQVVITASGTVNGQELKAEARLDVTDAVVMRLQVAPAVETTPVGLVKPFTATAILSDSTTVDVTNDSSLSWTSSEDAVATVVSSMPSGNGVAKGLTVGQTVITASGTVNGHEFTASARLDVTDATVMRLVVTPEVDTTPVGLVRGFIATAILSDGSPVTVTDEPAISWTSSDVTIATITSGAPAANGVAQGENVGRVTITAAGTVNGQELKAQAFLDVTDAIPLSLAVTPNPATTPVGLTVPLTATLTMSDGAHVLVTDNPDVSWSSNSDAIATVITGELSGNGVVKGETVGSTVITAHSEINGVPLDAQATVNVTNAVVVDLMISPLNRSIPVELTRDYTATAKMSDGSVIDVTTNSALSWSVINDVGSATITAQGVATGVTEGVVTIKAVAPSLGETVEATTPLTITPSVFPITWGSDSSGADISRVRKNLVNIKEVYNTLNAYAALKDDGTVVTWGDSNYGGDSSAVQSQLIGVTHIYSSQAGRAFAALKSDGSVVTWGPATEGGDSSAVASQLNSIDTIVGNGHAFAALKTDGTVVAWGNPSSGGDTSGLTAVDLSGVESVFAYPNSSTFAALKTDGTVVTWGDPVTGGDSSAVDLTNVKRLYGNAAAMAALKDDGTVVAWGRADAGGDASGVDLTNVKEVFSANNGAFAALKNDGTVVAWGTSAAGGDTSGVASELHSVETIKSTTIAFAAIRTDGSVVGWGGAGDYDLVIDSVSVAPDTLVANGHAIVGFETDGTPWAWGNMSNGADISGVDLTHVSQIIAHINGASFTALKDDGTAVSWGNSTNGGDNSAVQTDLVNIQRVFATRYAYCALRY